VSMKTWYIECGSRFHSDGTWAASPLEATSSTCEQILNAGPLLKSNSFSDMRPEEKVIILSNYTLICSHFLLWEGSLLRGKKKIHIKL
jgi:hypothetical protein